MDVILQLSAIISPGPEKTCL